MGLLEYLAIGFGISCIVALWVSLAIRNVNKDPEPSGGTRDDLAQNDHDGVPLTKEVSNKS